MLKTRAAVAMAFLVLGGCAALLDKVPRASMAERLRYQGFSFDRPASWDWYLRLSEEHFTSVTLRRDFWSASQTHTFYAIVHLELIERQPVTHEEFAELARTIQQAPYEIRTTAYAQQLTTRQNQWCIRFESSHVVLGAPVAPEQELVMIMRGFRCLHPTWPKTTINFYYSERGLPSEIDPEITAEGEEFLRGVRIDIAPDTPAF